MKRRNFIKNTALAGAAFGFPTIVLHLFLAKNAPSNKINIGQIGCGRIARDHDMPGVWQHDVARIVAVSDLDSNRMADGKKYVESYYTKKMGSPYLDVSNMRTTTICLRIRIFDAVVISTPDHWHSQPAMEAALAGKACLCAKTYFINHPRGKTTSRSCGIKLELYFN